MGMFISHRLPSGAAAGGVGTPLGELLLENDLGGRGWQEQLWIYRVGGTRNLPPAPLAPRSSQVMKR